MIRPAGVFLMYLLLPTSLEAQTSMEGGARAAALGGAQTALEADEAGYANPASWAALSGRAISFFATQAFSLPELRLGAAHYVEPTRFGTFALGARTFGFEDYRDTRLQAGYAIGVHPGTSRRLSIGVQMDYQRLTIPTYGAASTISMTLGLLAHLHPAVLVGFQVRNPHAPKLGDREELPRTLALGLSYLPHRTVRLLADVHKDVRFPLSVRAGAEVTLVPSFILRAGAATAPNRITAGAGLRLGYISADLAGEHHEVLGWSPGLALALRW